MRVDRAALRTLVLIATGAAARGIEFAGDDQQRVVQLLEIEPTEMCRQSSLLWGALFRVAGIIRAALRYAR